jgi:hypothetical protein
MRRSPSPFLMALAGFTITAVLQFTVWHTPHDPNQRAYEGTITYLR